MIQFAWPYIFLLFPLPWMVYRWISPCQKWQNVQLIVPDLVDFACFQKPFMASFSKIKYFCAFFIWLALLTAAARPQWVGENIEIPQSGRDLMLAVDLSGSMQMTDFKLNGQLVDRLTAIKGIVSEFIEKRKGDRIGLILFGSNAYLQVPLTFDRKTVIQLLNESAIGLAGGETAIGDAIVLAVKQLQGSPQKAKVLVLLTDGNNNAGALTPDKAADIAARAHLKIHTIAIGAKELLVRSFFGVQKINPSADIDEKTLQLIAEKTGGQYFRAYQTEELNQIYQHIDRLEVIERDAKYYRPLEEWYIWPLLFACILGILGFGYQEYRFA